MNRAARGQRRIPGWRSLMIRGASRIYVLPVALGLCLILGSGSVGPTFLPMTARCWAADLPVVDRVPPTAVDGPFLRGVDATTTAILDRLPAALASRQWPAVAEQLEQLLDRPPTASAWLDGRRVTARFAARLLVQPASHDAAAQALWQGIAERFDAVASAAWDRVKTQPADASLREFLSRYGWTRPGVLGWARLASRLLDQGRPQLAELAWRRVLEHPAADVPLREQAARAISVCESFRTNGRQSPQTPSAIHQTSSAGWAWWRAEGVPTLRAREAAHHDRMQQRRWPAAIGTILEQGPRVAVSLPEGMAGFDRDHGELLWTYPSDSSQDVAVSQVSQSRSSRRPHQLPVLQPAVGANSRRGGAALTNVTGIAAADQDRIYLRTVQTTAFVPQPGMTTKPVVGLARLDAIRWSDGQLAWSWTGVDSPATPPTAETIHLMPVQGVVSPPLVLDDRLLLVQLTTEATELVQLSAQRGTWLSRVAITPGREPSYALVEESETAAGVFAAGPWVAIVTAAPAIALYDPLLEELLCQIPLERVEHWHERLFNSNQLPPSRQPRNDAQTPAQCLPNGDSLICLVPCANQLVSLDRTTGRVRWQRPADDIRALQQTAVGPIAVGFDRIEVLDPGQPNPRWETAVPPLAGQGLVAADAMTVDFPLQSGQLLRVQLDSRTIRVTRRPVVDAEAGFGSGSATAYQLSDSCFSRWPGTAEHEFLDAGPLWLPQHSFHPPRLVPGQPKTTATETAAIDSLSVRIAGAWQLNQLESEPDSHTLERVRTAVRAARQRQTIGDWSSAMQLLWDAAADGVTEPVFVDELPHPGWARCDHWLQGELIAVLRGIPVEQQPAAFTWLNDSWSAATASPDPAAAAELYRRFWAVPTFWPRFQQDWLAIAGSLNPAERRHAIQWLQSVSRSVDSGDQPVALDRQAITQPVNIQHVLAGPQRQDVDVFVRPVPVSAPPDHPLADVAFAVERGQRYLRCRWPDDEHPRILALPRSQEATIEFHAGWLWDQSLLLQLDSRLLMIELVDEHGQPRPQILWRWPAQLTSPLSRPLSRRYLQSRRDPRAQTDLADRGPLATPLGDPIPQVFVVSPRLLVVHADLRLMGLDPVSGQPLWSRAADRPPAAVSMMGGELLVISDDCTGAEVWSTADGRVLDRWSLGDRVQQLQLRRESLVLIRSAVASSQGASPTTALQVEAWDWPQRQLRWQLPANRDDVLTVLDDDYLALISPASQAVQLLTNQNGPVGQPIPWTCPAAPIKTAVLSDPKGWLLLVSGRPQAVQAGERIDSLNLLRQPTIDGGILAIDRESSSLRWVRELRQAPFPLDQPRGVGVLVRTAAGRKDSDAAVTTGLVELIDRTNGQTVWQADLGTALPYSLLERLPSSAGPGWQLRLPNRTYRFPDLSDDHPTTTGR